MRPALLALALGLAAVPLRGGAPPFPVEKGIGLVVVERIGSPYLVIRDGDLAPGPSCPSWTSPAPLRWCGP